MVISAIASDRLYQLPALMILKLLQKSKKSPLLRGIEGDQAVFTQDIYCNVPQMHQIRILLDSHPFSCFYDFLDLSSIFSQYAQIRAGKND